ncbi:MAG: helix-turn-helix domain-containing protein [Chitinispirillia bacterium]|nr:helix-turn-helix domain-containing protein [Chitinispirillia bacterium]
MEKMQMKGQKVAERYSVTVESVWRWIRDGRLPAMRLTQRNYRIRPVDLEAFERGEGQNQTNVESR